MKHVANLSYFHARAAAALSTLALLLVISAFTSSNTFVRAYIRRNSSANFRYPSDTKARSYHSTLRRCEVEDSDLTIFERSQQGEDMVMYNKYFNKLCGGTYLELGGFDGETFSNTYMFQHGLDWRGVLIEANPISFHAMKENRPLDDTYNYAICSNSSEVHFIGKGLRAETGILEFMPPSFISDWHGNVDLKTLPTVPCKPLSSILDESSLDPRQIIDLFSLDVEGGEFQVVKTIDFTKHHFGIIFYEADGRNVMKDEAVKTLLEQNGYVFRRHHSGSNFHINHRWDEIYEYLIN